MLEIQGDASVTSAFTVTVDGNKIAGDTVELPSAATVTALGGAAFQGESNITAFATTVNVGSKYIVDPFRVKPVDSESRILEIDAEHRNLLVKSENRLNTLEQETRGLAIKSESRILKTQHLTLVENATGPLDTREG